jgi:hypothetical protein
VLEAAGKTFADVVRVGVFLTDIRDFQAMNSVYARFFQAPYPARTTVAVVALPLGAAVEIDLVAHAGRGHGKHGRRGSGHRYLAGTLTDRRLVFRYCQVNTRGACTAAVQSAM